MLSTRCWLNYTHNSNFTAKFIGNINHWRFVVNVCKYNMIISSNDQTVRQLIKFIFTFPTLTHTRTHTQLVFRQGSPRSPTSHGRNENATNCYKRFKNSLPLASHISISILNHSFLFYKQFNRSFASLTDVCHL